MVLFVLRTKYAKRTPVRFISHLDLTRAFIRAANRARLPIAFTEGFNPRPKLGLGPPLGVGMTSESEYIDFFLARPMPAETFRAQLNETLPEGLEVLEAFPVSGRHSLMVDLVEAMYSIRLGQDILTETSIGGTSGLEKRIETFLQLPEAPFSAKKNGVAQVKDLKAFVVAIETQPCADGIELLLRTRITNTGTCNPRHLVQWLLDLGEEDVRAIDIERKGLLFSKNRGEAHRAGPAQPPAGQETFHVS